MTPPVLLDTAAAAERLSCSEAMVRKLVADRRLAVIKVGTLVRFLAEDLDAFVVANRRAALSPRAVPRLVGERRARLRAVSE